ncbi:hypothetical protein MLD38_038725 [Melastoma candidum]|uniref:Uncharacterized protein n=1 Tax=Melastoma candidum TaxID=119954 RepID=A0ACB9L0U4_9MYRT|nr:hypothetical protein MLD38_038725 [Melastoma candidum]
MGSSRSRSRSRSRVRSMSTPPVTPSSSIDSSSDPPSCSSSPSSSPPRTCNDRQESRSGHPDTDLRLGLGGVGGGPSVSSSQGITVPRVAACRELRQDWPPIKPLLRSALSGRLSSDGSGGRVPCLFVKVYMEGVLIGRKLDLLAHQDYDDLVSTLARMFKTKIHSPGECAAEDGQEKKLYVLTYEDKDGDWMMVGDVPWEMFKSSVKRLMITRADKC